MLLSYEIQTAIRARLTGDSGLMALVTGIYDAVPQSADSADSADYPFVTIGDAFALDWSTDTETGTENFVDIHVWSRYNGTKELKQIEQIIYNLLNRYDLSVNGGSLVYCDFERTETPRLDTDGKTRHGIITFKITLDQQP